jgi:BirA family biotin operon repressor/biotin-[acetyl-CoA-carboxylase] ligase
VQTRPLTGEPGLHWPNDVYIGRRKLAGILVESLPGGHFVLGIGMNVNNSLAGAPTELREVAIALGEVTGQVHDRTQVLIDLLNQLQCELAALAAEPYKIGRQANELCLQRGEPLLIDTGQETVSGSCAGIEPDGALVMMTDCGPRKFYAGVLRHTRSVN